MDPKQLRAILRPVVAGEVDYAKANRLYYRRSMNSIPRHRYLGNAFLSMLTKIASGYWHVADSQTGYTAISLDALETVDLGGVYPSYGYPNDMLVRLNAYDFRVADVPIRATYNIGEKSKMRLGQVIPRMSWLIFKRFLWRMWHKHVIQDFHPLVLFYAMSMLLLVLSVPLFVRMMYMWIIHPGHTIGPINALMWALCMLWSTQFSLFAMWFDMEMNRHLNPSIRRWRNERRQEEGDLPVVAPDEAGDAGDGSYVESDVETFRPADQVGDSPRAPVGPGRSG
jgi:hypothetical protein